MYCLPAAADRLKVATLRAVKFRSLIWVYLQLESDESTSGLLLLLAMSRE